LEIRRRTNAQVALFPVVAGGDENVEVAAICAAGGGAEERSQLRVVSARAPCYSGVEVESTAEQRGVKRSSPSSTDLGNEDCVFG